jgi:uncharacterized membrane protein YdbT with pleckstrin-like domain
MDVLWTQHPAARARIGRLAAGAVLGVALAAGWWWLPLIAHRLAVPDGWMPSIERVAAWMPLALALPLAQGLGAWLGSRLVRYDLTAEQLLVTRGLLVRRTDNLELYRVRDLRLELPLLGRLVGVGDVVLDTVDHTTPTVVLSGVKQPHEVFARLRDLTEGCRRKAGIGVVAG